jgi:hypothetical protein
MSMRYPGGALRPPRPAGANRFGALSSGLGQFGERAPFQLRDLEQAIEDERPDVLFVDEGAWGAAAAAERSGLPWAFSIVSPVPLPSRDAPPFGLGLVPRHDRLGRVRDRLTKPLTLGTLERVIARHMNPLRAGIGLAPGDCREQAGSSRTASTASRVISRLFGPSGTPGTGSEARAEVCGIPLIGSAAEPEGPAPRAS